MRGERKIFLFDSTMTNWKVTHVAGEHWFLVEREYTSIEGAVQSIGELVRMPLFGFCFSDCIIPAVITRVSIHLHDGVRVSMSFDELRATEAGLRATEIGVKSK